MSRRYFDTAYLCKLHWPEAGSNEVLACASGVDEIACGIHGRAEFASVCLRKLREGVATREQLTQVYAQFDADLAGGLIRFLPLTGAVEAVRGGADFDDGAVEREPVDYCRTQAPVSEGLRPPGE